MSGSMSANEEAHLFIFHVSVENIIITDKTWFPEKNPPPYICVQIHYPGLQWIEVGKVDFLSCQGKASAQKRDDGGVKPIKKFSSKQVVYSKENIICNEGKSYVVSTEPNLLCQHFSENPLEIELRYGSSENESFSTVATNKVSLGTRMEKLVMESLQHPDLREAPASMDNQFTLMSPDRKIGGYLQCTIYIACVGNSEEFTLKNECYINNEGLKGMSTDTEIEDELLDVEDSQIRVGASSLDHSAGAQTSSQPPQEKPLGKISRLIAGNEETGFSFYKGDSSNTTVYQNESYILSSLQSSTESNVLEKSEDYVPSLPARTDFTKITSNLYFNDSISLLSMSHENLLKLSEVEPSLEITDSEQQISSLSESTESKMRNYLDPVDPLQTQNDKAETREHEESRGRRDIELGLLGRSVLEVDSSLGWTSTEKDEPRGRSTPEALPGESWNRQSRSFLDQLVRGSINPAELQTKNTQGSKEARGRNVHTMGERKERFSHSVEHRDRIATELADQKVKATNLSKLRRSFPSFKEIQRVSPQEHTDLRGKFLDTAKSQNQRLRDSTDHQGRTLNSTTSRNQYSPNGVNRQEHTLKTSKSRNQNSNSLEPRKNPLNEIQRQDRSVPSEYREWALNAPQPRDQNLQNHTERRGRDQNATKRSGLNVLEPRKPSSISAQMRKNSHRGGGHNLSTTRTRDRNSPVLKGAQRQNSLYQGGSQIQKPLVVNKHEQNRSAVLQYRVRKTVDQMLHGQNTFNKVQLNERNVEKSQQKLIRTAPEPKIQSTVVVRTLGKAKPMKKMPAIQVIKSSRKVSSFTLSNLAPMKSSKTLQKKSPPILKLFTQNKAGEESFDWLRNQHPMYQTESVWSPITLIPSSVSAMKSTKMKKIAAKPEDKYPVTIKKAKGLALDSFDAALKGDDEEVPLSIVQQNSVYHVAIKNSRNKLDEVLKFKIYDDEGQTPNRELTTAPFSNTSFT